MKPILICLIAELILSVGASNASTFLVRPDGSGDLPTIQAAIDVAYDGDEILLADGVFRGAGNRDVSFQGKAIRIRSVSLDPGACIVNCEEAAPGFLLISGEGQGSGLEGITVMNGYSAQRGGAVTCCDAYPVIQNCRFIGNSTAMSAGGALFICGGDPIVRDCVFDGNWEQSQMLVGAGAVLISGAGSPSAPIFERCTFANNTAISGSGAVMASVDAEPRFVSCTFYRNEGNHGTISVSSSSSLDLDRSILAFGVGSEAIDCGPSSEVRLTCVDIYGNEAGDWTDCIADQLGQSGNIQEDPLFCDPLNGDLTIRSDSSCAPDANPECGLIGAWPVGCEDPSPSTPTTWGAIRAAYR